jgi:hypothetical protein
MPAFANTSTLCVILDSHPSMQINKKTRTVYNFRNTCQKCFNDVEFPLLGDFSYGELIFQTTDGKDFYIAVIIENGAFDFIREAINNSEELTAGNVDPEKILVLVADKPNNQQFSINYPLCPNCKMVQTDFNDNIRTGKKALRYVTWHGFERLPDADKLMRVAEVARSIA